jgi:hypothetical protein
MALVARLSIVRREGEILRKPSEAEARNFTVVRSICANALRGGIRVTIGSMILAILGMRLLEVMFFVGLVGSAIVVLISFVEDGKELFGKDE